MNQTFGILGAGSQADEVEEYAPPGAVAFRAVSAEHLPDSSGCIDIVTRDPERVSLPVVAAVGAPGLRRHLVSLWSGVRFHTVTAAGASVGRSVTLGVGCIVAPGAILTYRAQIGDHVIINVGATISHGSVIGDYATISPGVHIAGDCIIGEGVFVGIGAVVSHGVSVPAGSVIGAGAAVVHDIDVPGVYVGVPARRIRSLDDWLYSL